MGISGREARRYARFRSIHILFVGNCFKRRSTYAFALDSITNCGPTSRSPNSSSIYITYTSILLRSEKLKVKPLGLSSTLHVQMNLPTRNSWLFLAGLVSFCVFIILTIIAGPKFPTSLTIDEIIDPITGQPRTPEEQGRILQRKMLKSQAFELLISAFVFLGITVLACGTPILLTWCQGRRRVAPSTSTSPRQTHSPSTIPAPDQTSLPIVHV